MARSPLLKRLDRLDQAAIGEYIVYEGNDDIPDEEHERFRREEIGEIAPNSTIVFIRRFSFEPHVPLRLVDRRPLSSRGGLGAASRAGPVQSPPVHPAMAPTRLLQDEEVVPKRHPALLRRGRNGDTADL